MLLRAARNLANDQSKGAVPMHFRRALYPPDGSGSHIERFAVASLDERGGVLELEVLFQGSASSTTACPYETLRWVRRRAGSPRRFAVAHNHPNGLARPSNADRVCSSRLQRLAAVMGLELVHDLVITLTESFDILHRPDEAPPRTPKAALDALCEAYWLHLTPAAEYLPLADRRALAALQVHPEISAGAPFRHRGEGTVPAILAPCSRATLDRLTLLGMVEPLPRRPGKPTLYRLGRA